MNAAGLLEHFDRIAEAPDAVERLRRFVLDLAVRGKLVEQHAHDQPAASLLLRIAEITGTKSKPAVGATPFDLPTGWSWSTVGALASKTGSGSTPRGGREVYRSSGIPFLRSQNVYNDGLRLGDVAFIDEQTHHKMAGTAVEPGDLLLNITGGSIGRCCRLPNDEIEANISQHVAIIRMALPELRDYSHIVILSPFFQSFVIGEQTGAGRGGLPKNRMDQIPFPLPPLAEQHRIVAKVDELMALCDQLQAAHTARESQRDALVAASLHRLTATEATPDQPAPPFTDAARFHLTHLPRLTTRPEHIQQLRQTILNLAVRGKLVKQDASEVGVSSGEEEQLAPQLALLPRSWTWSRAESLCDEIIDCPHSTPTFEASGVICLDTNTFKGGKVLPAKIRYVSEAGYEERIKRLEPRAGDIVFAREGSVGESVVIPDGMRCCLGQRVMLFRPKAHVTSRYFQLALSEPSALGRLLALHKGIGARHVNVKDMRKAFLPLPPLAEQHRIVAKVDELMQLCDVLQAQLLTGQTQRSRLLEALLHESLQEQKQRHDNVIDIEVARRRREAQREAVACHAIRATRGRRWGRLKQVKAMFAAEAHCGLQLGGVWPRDKLGPYDQWVEDFEARAASKDWFHASERTLANGDPKIDYTPGKSLDHKADEALAVLGDQATEFDRVLTLFAERTTTEVEIIATVFAAWNDLLIDSRPPTEDNIVREVRERWHPAKERFAPDVLKGWMKWMRQQHLIPVGRAPHTQYQAGLL